MPEKTNRMHDAYAFSLGGIATKSSYILTPAIAHDRINRKLAEKPGQAEEDQPSTEQELSCWGRFWLRARRRAA